MQEYHEILERRVGQFCVLLERMRERRSTLTKGNAFLIVHEGKEGDECGSPSLAEAAKVPLTIDNSVGQDAFAADLSEGVSIDLPDEGWRSDPSSTRFVQFSFGPQYLDMDIPNTTLCRIEAEEIMRYRSGFFYVADRPAFEHPQERAAVFTPLRKAYVYGDESTAAEDMAFVFFRVWKFPVDWTFYVTASAFHDPVRWERNMPLSVDDP